MNTSAHKDKRIVGVKFGIPEVCASSRIVSEVYLWETGEISPNIRWSQGGGFR